MKFTLRIKMMNLIGLCLIVTSLATSGVLSPNPKQKIHTQLEHDQEDHVIVKEGHRVVVVEFNDKGEHKTKVSISPEDQDHHNHYHDGGAASVLPNLGPGISTPQASDHDHGAERTAPRELICDAFGKCKHKIANAMGKAKEKVSEAIHEAHEVGENVGDVVSKTQETVSEKAYHIKEEAQEGTKQAFNKAKAGADKVTETVKNAKDVGKTIGEDVERNVSEWVASTEEQVIEKGREVRDKVKKETHRGLEFFKKIVWGNLTSPMSWRALMGVTSLLGFSTAYGMSMWVTFISSYILADAIPRQQFAVVQSKIYPVYFTAMASSISMALLGFIFSHAKLLFSSKGEMFQGYLLLSSLLMVLANSLYLEPLATKVMFERLKVEKEEGRRREEASREGEQSRAPSQGTGDNEARVVSKIDGMNKRLKKLNSYSSFLNVLTLMALSSHLVYLSNRSSRACTHH